MELGFGEAEAAGEQLWEATSPSKRYHSDETKVPLALPLALALAPTPNP